MPAHLPLELMDLEKPRAPAPGKEPGAQAALMLGLEHGLEERVKAAGIAT